MAKTFDGATGILAESAGFCEGTFHAAIENPINGVVQIANEMTGARLPEMHLVNDTQQNLGFQAGATVGMALDYYVLNKMGGSAMGDLGGTGIGGAMLRSGVVGGIYSGILTPSDINSKSLTGFLGDRLGNAAVGAATFSAMAGAGGLLGQTGKFAVPEARSLLSNMTFNGLSGVAGGLTHAEASALIKQGKPIASPLDFVKDGLTYGTFGAAFGAIDYGAKKLANPLQSTDIASQGASATVFRNGEGDIVKIETNQPSVNYPGVGVHVEAAKNMVGSWNTTSAKAYNSDTGENFGPATKPIISTVEQTSDGALKVQLESGDVRVYSPNNGPYEVDTAYLRNQAALRSELAAGAQRMADDILNNGTTDKAGNVSKSIETEGLRSGGATMDSTGVVQEAYINGEDGGASFQRTAPDSFKILLNNAEYDWHGDIKPITAPSGRLLALDLIPENGEPVRFGATGPQPTDISSPTVLPDAAPARTMIANTANFIKYSDSFAYARVGDDGTVYLRGGRWQTPSANGTKIGLDETPIKVGDRISITSDAGDRFPLYKTVRPKWGTAADGTPTLNGQALKPNSLIDMQLLTQGA